MESEEEKTSKFSSGLNIIKRLDILWINCQNFKRKGQYSSWNDELDTIWLELARDIKQEEYEDSTDEITKEKKEGYHSKFIKFDKDLAKELPFNDSNKGFSIPDNDMITRRNKQYEILMNKQLFL